MKILFYGTIKKLYIFIVIMFFSYSKIVSAKCTCSSNDNAIKKDLSRSIETNNLVFTGIVEEIIMIDGYSYIAKIKAKDVWKDTLEITDEAKNKTDNKDLTQILSKINIVDTIKEEAISKLKNDDSKKEDYYYALSSNNIGSCDFSFHVGWHYLIYAKIKNDFITTSQCSRTDIETFLYDDIEKLKASNKKKTDGTPPDNTKSASTQPKNIQ